MLYLVKINDITDYENKYHIFETCTESLIIGNKSVAIKLVEKHKIKAKNFSIHEGQVVLKQWPHEIKRSSDAHNTFQSDFVLLTNINEQRFKLVSILGDVTHVYTNELKDLVKLGRITNCTFNKHKNSYKSTDTYTIQNNPKFEKSIAEQYEVFRAKVLLLGLDISFEYSIEDNDVNLKNYTGSSSAVILPNFITIIRKKALYGKGIKELKLSNRLKFIGSKAFEDNEIHHIEIPESVEFIGPDAFFKNQGLLSRDGNIDKSKVIVLNGEAFV